MRSRPPSSVPLGQLGDPGEVEQGVRSPVVEVQLHHHVRAALDRHRVRTLRLRRRALRPGWGRQELHHVHRPARRRPRSARRAIGDVEDTSPGLSRPKGERSTRKWCMFGADSRPRRSRRPPRARPAHLPQGLLQREAVDLGELRQQRVADGGVRRRPSRSLPGSTVPSAWRQRRGQRRWPGPGRRSPAAWCSRRRGSPRNSDPVDLRTTQVPDARADHVAAVRRRPDDRGRADLRPGPQERVVVVARSAPSVLLVRTSAARSTGSTSSTKCRARRSANSSIAPTPCSRANANTVFFWVSVGSTVAWSPSRVRRREVAGERGR